jgi:hypothetical protein
MRKALQFMWDVNHTYKTSEDDFLTATESIENQVCAMRLAWTVSVGSLKTNRPDLSIGLVPLPTWTGENSPAYGVGSPDPQSFGVPATSPPDRQEVAFQIIAWLYSNPEFLLDNSLTLNTPPSTPQIANHPLLAQNDAIAALAPVTEWAVPSGLGVPEVEQVVMREWLWDGIYLSGMDIDEALASCQEDVDSAVDQFKADFELHAAEHTYGHADLMNYPDCLS